MHLFHKLADGQCIITKGGRFWQRDLYTREVGSALALYVLHCGAFIRLAKNGTSVPGILWIDMDTGGKPIGHDTFGRLTIHG